MDITYPQRNLNDKKRIFCYRLSHFCRMSENAFGILGCRFQFFLGRLNLTLETAVDAVLAAVTLHNLLRLSPVNHTLLLILLINLKEVK